MDCLATGSKLLNPLLRSCSHCSLRIRGIISRLVFISFLCHFELTTCDEIYTIYCWWAFTIDLLTSDELFGSHILINFFNDVWPQGRKDTESSQEFDNLFQLSFLFLSNDPDVILSVESSKTTLGGTKNSGCSTIVLKECKLTKWLTSV